MLSPAIRDKTNQVPVCHFGKKEVGKIKKRGGDEMCRGGSKDCRGEPRSSDT